MTKRNTSPRLSRRYAFVKRDLLRLPQQPQTIEVDFCPLPDIVEDEYGFWLGLVVDHDTGTIAVTTVLDKPPTAEDAADVVTRALECSHFRPPCRPQIAYLRDNPSWEALYPWLGQLEVETVLTDDLLQWDAKAEELIEWMRKHWSPVPQEFRTTIHEQYGIFGTLSELRLLTVGRGETGGHFVASGATKGTISDDGSRCDPWAGDGVEPWLGIR